MGLWMNATVSVPLEVRSVCSVDKFKASVITIFASVIIIFMR